MRQTVTQGRVNMHTHTHQLITYFNSLPTLVGKHFIEALLYGQNRGGGEERLDPHKGNKMKRNSIIA